jgi:prolipoprotein diacylglyceryltransferase
LYEVLVAGLLAALCWWWWRRRRSDGQVALLGCIGYGIWRIINEWLREDKVMTTCWGLFPASTAQVISIHLLLAAALVTALVLWGRRRHPAWARQSRLVPGSRHAPPGPPEQP